jgi:hypothetical protein
MLEAAHIIAQRETDLVSRDESIFARAGLHEKNKVNNGLLLCPTCHGLFDSLKRYVEVKDGKLVFQVLKPINSTDENDEAVQGNFHSFSIVSNVSFIFVCKVGIVNLTNTNCFEIFGRTLSMTE